MKGCVFASLIIAGDLHAAALNGRLYVIDSHVVLDTANNPTTQILLLDLSTGNTIRTFPAGYKPDAALSPDGSRLYVISKVTSKYRPTLVVYDTRSGAPMATVDNPDEPETTSPYSGGGMWFSPSGKWIYLRKDHQTPGHDDVYLAVFDTAHNRFLPARAHLGGGNCFSAQVIPAANDLTVDVTCLRSASEIVFDESREAVTQTAIWSSPENEPLLAGAVPRSNGHFNFLLRDAIPGRLIDGFRAPVTRGGNNIYFATRPLRYPGALFADEIVQADAETLTPRATIRTPEPFLSICVSDDGSTIFAISPETSSITAIDASTLTVSGTVKPAGSAPSFVIPAPPE